MNKPLNALLLDDSHSDAELLLYELRRGGFAVSHILVDNADDFRAALRQQRWDIILSDYSMPSFTALDALEVLHEENINLPFIVISGTVGEDAAVAAMKAGARDFFSKGHLKRIVQTVERELNETAERRKRDEAEARFATAFNRSPVGTVISRLANGVVLDVNQRFLDDYHVTRERIIGRTATGIDIQINPDERAYIARLLRDTGSASSIEVEYADQTGKHGFALLSAEIIEIDNEPCVLTMVLDITERKKAEKALRASEEKFRLLAENSTDMISRQTPEGDYLYASPSCRTLLGYAPEELIGHSAYEFAHPDDLEAIRKSHRAVLNLADSYTVVYRIRRQDGRYTWVESISHAVLDLHTGLLVEIQSASRDVSERKAAEDAARRYADRLELLHDIDRAILLADHPQTIAGEVLTRLQSLTGFDSASVTAFDAHFREFTVLASIEPIPDYRPYEDARILELLKHGDVYLMENLLNSTHVSPSDQSLTAAGYHSYVWVPLMTGGKLIGSFHLRAKQASAFSSEAVAIAKEVAAQLAIAIENTRLLGVEQRRTRELSALHEASLQLTGSLNLENVLDSILNYAVRLVQANDAHLFLYDGETLRFGAAQRDGQRLYAPFAEPRPQGLTYTVARSGERLIVPNVNLHPAYQNWQWGGAIIGLPLKVGKRVVGVMSMTYLQPHEFEEHELQLLELLADQAAIAVHNAQLYQQIQKHAAELEQRVQERTQELQSSESKYRSLIEFAPDPIVIVNARGVITLTNKRAEDSFGYSRQELVGQPVEILIPVALHDIHMEHRSAYLEAPNQRSMGANVDPTARHKDGTEIPVKIGLSPINTGDETLVMAYIVDITADKQLESSLRTALAREKELNELKTSFTSIVSHEFRTPLSVILSSTELLSTYGERMDLGRRREKLENIIRQVKRLIQLLDDVLMITRSESAGFAYKPVTLDLVALCEEILDEIRVGYRQDVSIEFATEGDCRACQADEFLFSHILQNLASNALKYSRAGGTVQVHLNCAPAELTLRVQDQGIGIPENDQSRLFEAFRRAANVGQIKGTGIGLSIVKRAVDACGGRIIFESIEGQGTTFIVTLPIARQKENTAIDHG